jgi:hypothetical protein
MRSPSTAAREGDQLESCRTVEANGFRVPLMRNAPIIEGLIGLLRNREGCNHGVSQLFLFLENADMEVWRGVYDTMH